MRSAAKDSVTKLDWEEDRIGKEVVDAAFCVHKAFGPGLLESLYEACLVQELSSRGLVVENQKAVHVRFRGKDMGLGYRIDVFVEGKVVVEVRSVEKLLPVQEAQILTYMKLVDARLGYLVNFNTPLVKDRIKRVVRRK